MMRQGPHVVIWIGFVLFPSCLGIDDRSPGIASPPGIPLGNVPGASGPGDGSGGNVPGDPSGALSPAANEEDVLPDGAGATFAFDPGPQSGWVGRPLARIGAKLVDASGTSLMRDGVRVSLSLRSENVAARLIGFPETTTVFGRALFDSIGVDAPGVGYVLEVQADGVISTRSDPFDVAAEAFLPLSTGLNNQEVISLVATSAQPPLLVASTTASLMRSVDGGGRWERADFGSPGPVSKLVVHPQRPTVLYAAGRPAGIIGGFGFIGKSIDGGRTWREPRPDFPTGSVASVALSPANSAALVACSDRGIFRSVDEGDEWSPTAFTANCRAIAFDPNNPTTVFALVNPTVTSGHEVHISKDEGENWQPSLSSPLNLVDLVSTSLGVFAIGPVGMHVTRDGGATWTQSGLAADHLVAAPSDPTRMYLAAGATVRASLDGGASFSDPADIAEATIRALAVDPTNPSRLYAATAVGVYVSFNGGSSWNDPTAGLAGGAAQSVAVRPGDPATVFASDALGLARSNDGGGTWTRYGNVPRVIAFSFHPDDPSRAFACSVNGLLLSLDGGATWSEDPLSGDCGDMAIAGERMFMSTLSNGVRRSVDEGVTWESTSLTQPSYSVAVSPDGRTVFAGTNTGSYRSTDAGDTWQAVLPADIVQAWVVDRYNPDRVYAGADCRMSATVASAGGFMRSLDGGASWERTALRGCFADMVQGPSGALYALGPFTFGFGVSTDGGNTWTDGGRGLSGGQQIAIANDELTIYVAGYSGVFRSSTGGLAP